MKLKRWLRACLCSRLYFFILLIFFSDAFAIKQTQANLGGLEASVSADRQELRGRQKVLSQRNYKIYEINTDVNQIREYVLPDGRVFAVSWRGISQPDLSLLLGDHYQDYVNVTSNPVGPQQSRGARVMRSKNLVLERSGHMRDVRGRAYLSDLIPEGFKTQEIP